MYIAGPGYVYKSVDGGRHFYSLVSGFYGAGLEQDNRVVSVDPYNSSVVLGSAFQFLGQGLLNDRRWTLSYMGC